MDENTIGICVILGLTYTGEYEDVKAVNDLLLKKNIDCPVHVDAASGGFVAPFLSPDLEWDFRLEKVVSINVSGHKYGLVSLDWRARGAEADLVIGLSRCRMGCLADARVLAPGACFQHQLLGCRSGHFYS